ncbi:Dynamin-like GTPase that mediates homotypic ER fusion [Lithohypha guttulata]|nr:Dynamin-like GTPase that mediates homotypic ER fusion [Lithohypha guttulata]
MAQTSQPPRSPISQHKLSSRPSMSMRSATAPEKMDVNGHMASRGQNGHANFEHGVQVIDEDKEFNPDLGKYLSYEDIARSGFNYHLVSVFGSQSTGKSTLLNALFGTSFNVMSESERRQTTKGIWMSKNKSSTKGMADNILVMDVEGTDGRERGEDQDFERKSSLFALATSEVLMVNIWEHQVGLYQGANMGLLKTVFEVNLQLFLRDRKTTSRSLIYFVVRDFLGTTPLQNLRNTLMQDMAKIWTGLNKPQGLENSSIDDYFDFAFTALPHKIYAPEKFEQAVKDMATRFKEAQRDPRRDPLRSEFESGVFMSEYHRRIPADGLPHYAEGIWDQIVNNKDLDLPTQQELLAQFRCDEIMREVMVAFDQTITPFETKQTSAASLGQHEVIEGLGAAMTTARSRTVQDFETEAGRYHKGVYQRKRTELESKIDTRLKALFAGQLTAAHKNGISKFSEAVSNEVKAGQKKGAAYDFAEIVSRQKQAALKEYETQAKAVVMEGVEWSSYKQESALFQKEIDQVSGQLRRDEMRRLATRVERWVKSKLNDSVGLEFNAIGSGRGGSGASDGESGDKPSEQQIWDRIWTVFTTTVTEAEKRFSDRARAFDASEDEIEVGKWRLRRKSWTALRAKIDEEMMEGNLLLKLRENFEDKFRYDEAGVPRIWRPTDDMDGLFRSARESTLTLIPLLSKFRLSQAGGKPPPLDDWIGNAPPSATGADEEDLVPIGGIDEEEGKSLEEETTMLSETKRQDLTVRFKKAAEGVFVEAKRSTVSGMQSVPLYFYAILLALGWNELVAVLRNPVYFIFLAMLGAAAYVTWTLNLWGPIMNMSNAAGTQALEEGKKRLREFLESSETGRQTIGMTPDSFELKSMNSSRSSGGTSSRKAKVEEEDVEDI